MFASLLPPPPLPARALLLAALSIARRNMCFSLFLFISLLLCGFPKTPEGIEPK
jgi:hypothetical protein